MTEEIDELERQVRNLHDLLARQKMSYELEIKLEVAAERERCANLCDEVDSSHLMEDSYFGQGCMACKAAILGAIE